VLPQLTADDLMDTAPQRSRSARASRGDRAICLSINLPERWYDLERGRFAYVEGDGGCVVCGIYAVR
jgi:hypothetical protein